VPWRIGKSLTATFFHDDKKERPSTVVPSNAATLRCLSLDSS